MSAGDASMSHHPAPKRHAVKLHEGMYALLAGPLAWFLQLNAGFALASQPCFKDGSRMTLPTIAPDWTWPAMIAIIVAAFVVSVSAAALSLRVYRRTRDEAKGDHRQLMEMGSGRTRFLALWGICLGAGSALATILTGFGFFVLPRCAG